MMGAVCSVVVRWVRGQPIRILALRDEIVGREFDDPGHWWSGAPTVVGGRDRAAGGTWCASRVDTGTTALVLNRPSKRVAGAGAPSRGVLPLLAVEHGMGWVEGLSLPGMASFALVLGGPDGLIVWDFDGARLTETAFPEGVSMVTSGGPEDSKADRYLRAFTEASFPNGWRELVQLRPPSDDPGALVVRREYHGSVFATVFGQLIEQEPGRLDMQFSREPWRGPWHQLAED
jgi:hypothetical protein